MCCLFVFTSLKHNQEKNVFLFLWEEPLVLRILDDLVGGWGGGVGRVNYVLMFQLRGDVAP